MANGRVGKVEDVLNIGDIVKVEVIEVSDSGKISLDRVDKPDVVSSERPSRHHDDSDRRGKREGSNGGRKPRRRHNGDHTERTSGIVRLMTVMPLSKTVLHCWLIRAPTLPL